MTETKTVLATEECPRCGAEVTARVLAEYARGDHPLGTACPECPRNGESGDPAASASDRAQAAGRADSGTKPGASRTARSESIRKVPPAKSRGARHGAARSAKAATPHARKKPPTPVTTAATPAGRKLASLRPGELEAMVLDYLRQHPGDLSPIQVAKAINRSSGAVANALAKHAKLGTQVRQTSAKPRRYASYAEASGKSR
jgi:hypothetical protein